MRKNVIEINEPYNERIYKKRKLCRSRLPYILAIIFSVFFLSLTSADAAVGLALYNYQTKQEVAYTGQQVIYTYNGKKIPSKNTPGIIINGYSLASFRDVFVNSGIQMKYIYEEKAGKLTLTKGDTVMVMTLGSKTVLVNGKKATVSLAPVKMKYKEQKVSKILVPARFVAETFGYSYEWNSKTSTAAITETLRLNYNNKDITYTGTQGRVTIDKSAVTLSSIPVIIADDTALLPAWKVFAKSSVKAGYSYDKNSGEVTLTKGDTVIKLTIGSKTAYVNGAEEVMDTVPLLVTNRSSKESSVMVPGSFVATNLGYGYSWNNETKTSQITTKKAAGENGTGNQTGTGNTPLPDATLFQWGISPEHSESYTEAGQVINTAEVSEDREATADIESINLTRVFDTDSGKEVYTVNAGSPISKTTIETEGNILKLHINNSYIDTASYNLGGVLAGELNTDFNALDNSGEVHMYLSEAKTKYQVTLSEDQCTLTITLYPNYINEVTAGRKNGEEFFNVTAMEEMSVTLTESGDSLILQFPFTVSGVGNQITAGSLEAIKAVTVANDDDYTASITIEKAPGISYRVEQAENSYTILFGQDAAGTGENTPENSQTALQFKLPEGVFYSDITTEDRYRYYQNQIAILLPGDHTEFYAANPVTSASEVVKDVSVSYVNDSTEIIIETSKLQGFRLAETGSSVDVTLGDPREIYRNIVLLDPGHGGNAAGATRTLNGVKIMEKDLNLTILYNLAQEYFNAPDSEIKVYYTRYGDEVRYTNSTTENYDRAEQAERVGADIYVSLHMNSHTTTAPTGTEVYYTGSNNSPNESGLTSKKLGEMFLESLTVNLGTVNRGVKDKSLIVTRENTVPAVLIELGFMSNPTELALLNDQEFQEEAAKTIYDTICQVFESYPTGR